VPILEIFELVARKIQIRRTLTIARDLIIARDFIAVSLMVPYLRKTVSRIEEDSFDNCYNTSDTTLLV
jgi:hypothetical protein